MPSNSPQIELSTILSPSSCLKVKNNNFSHQKMTSLIIQYAIFFKGSFKIESISKFNLSQANLGPLRRDDVKNIWPFTPKKCGLSPQMFVAVTLGVRGRSPRKLLAVHPGRSWPFPLEVRGRSPRTFVAVHPRSSRPFTPDVRGRSPQKFVAVHPRS